MYMGHNKSENARPKPINTYYSLAFTIRSQNNKNRAYHYFGIFVEDAVVVGSC